MIQKSFFTLCSLMFISMNIFAQYSNPKEITAEKIIAKVDNFIILKSDLETAYLEFMSRQEFSGGANPRCEVLENLVINKMMVAKAEMDSIVVAPEEVDQELDGRMQYFIQQIGSEEKIQEYYNKSVAQFKAEMREDIEEQLIVRRMQRELTADLKVTPSEVKRFFNSIPRDSLPYFSTEASVSQIVKKPIISRGQKDEVRKKLGSIRQRILDGEDFGELAKEFSADPGSAKEGGNLGFWKRGELAPQFEATALKLKPGEISQPVETEFGFHIIQLVERRGNTYSSKHILMQPASSTVDIDRAKNYLDSLRTQIMGDSITFEKAASEYSDDKQTATSGGFFTDDTGSNRISVEELDPAIFFAIDTMEVGTISKPIVFKTPDGKEAVRILYYKSRIKPHVANLNEDYQKIRDAALNQKRSKKLDAWFKDARKDVFINIDDEYNQCKIIE